MFWIIALALAAVVVTVMIAGLAVHLLFTPWVLVAVAIVAWIKFRPRGSRR